MITASMATIKGREDQMNRAYGSLLAQAGIDTILVHDSPHEAREDDARKFLGEPERQNSHGFGQLGEVET